MGSLNAAVSSRMVYAFTVVVALACFGSGMNYSWHLYDDDMLRFGMWAGWDDWSGLVSSWTHQAPIDSHYRPIGDSVLWLAHQLWGEWAVGYRLLNLTLHLGAVFWAIALFRRLRVPGPELVGFFIALHPLAVQPVMWMAQSRGVLADLLFVGALWALVRQHLEQSWRWGVLGLLLLALALLSKTTAASFPLLLLILVLLYRIRPTRQAWIFIVSSFAVTIAIGLLDRHFVVERGDWMSPENRAERTFMSTLQYLRNLLVPYPLGLYYDERITPLEWGCAGMVAAAVFVMCATKRWRQLRVLALVLAAFFVTIAPAMVGHITWSWTPTQDRYQHLSTFVLVAYLAYVLASVMPSSPGARRTVIAAVAVLGVVVVLTTFRVVQTHSTAYRFYTATERTAPRNKVLVFELAFELDIANQLKAAKWVIYEREPLIREHGTDALAQAYLAWLDLQLGDCKKGLRASGRHYWARVKEAAIKLECPDPAVRDYRVGTALVMQMQIDEVVRILIDGELSGLFGLHYRAPQITALSASASAAAGRFDEAERLIVRALADPWLQGRGKIRARIRADLLARQQAYRSGSFYASPASQALWRMPL